MQLRQAFTDAHWHDRMAPKLHMAIPIDRHDREAYLTATLAGPSFDACVTQGTHGKQLAPRCHSGGSTQPTCAPFFPRVACERVRCRKLPPCSRRLPWPHTRLCTACGRSSASPPSPQSRLPSASSPRASPVSPTSLLGLVACTAPSPARAAVCKHEPEQHQSRLIVREGGLQQVGAQHRASPTQQGAAESCAEWPGAGAGGVIWQTMPS